MLPPSRPAPLGLLIASLVGVGALGAACSKARPPLPEDPVTTRLTPEVDGLRAELVTEGPLDQRVVSGDGADFVLLYGAEEGGSLDPCGCQDRPRGGLPRLAAYRDAVQAADPSLPVLLLDAGAWLSGEANLDGSVRPDVPHRNGWMLRGLHLLGPTALNLSAADMRGLADLGGAPLPGTPAIAATAALPAPSTDAALPLVSAHLRAGPPLTVQVQPWVEVDAGDLTIGITGIGAPGPAWMAPPGWTIDDPLTATRAVLEELAPRVDVVVLMAHALPEVARTLAEEGRVDIVVDAWNHRAFTTPFRVGDAVWVRAHHQTMRVGELRVQVEDGRVSRAIERNVDLDPGLPSEPQLGALADKARAELKRLERTTYGRAPPR